MALNPFEQLRLFLSESRTAFEDIVGDRDNEDDFGKYHGQLKLHEDESSIPAPDRPEPRSQNIVRR